MSVCKKNPFGSSVDQDVTKKNLTVLTYMMVCQCSVHGIGMPFVLLAKGDGIPNFEFVTRTVWVSELVPAWREMKR